MWVCADALKLASACTGDEHSADGEVCCCKYCNRAQSSGVLINREPPRAVDFCSKRSQRADEERRPMLLSCERACACTYYQSQLFTVLHMQQNASGYRYQENRTNNTRENYCTGQLELRRNKYIYFLLQVDLTL